MFNAATFNNAIFNTTIFKAALTTLAILLSSFTFTQTAIADAMANATSKRAYYQCYRAIKAQSPLAIMVISKDIKLLSDSDLAGHWYQLTTTRWQLGKQQQRTIACLVNEHGRVIGLQTDKKLLARNLLQ